MIHFSWSPDTFGSILKAKVEELLSAGGDVDTLFRAAALCAESAEEACHGRAAACAAGCPHCCVLNVAALLPEAAVIASWVRNQFSQQEMVSLISRLTSHNSWARWMDDEERIARMAFCPFLDEAARCSVHPVRPLACRSVISLDSARCREAFTPIISDEERSVPSDLMRRAVFDAAFAAFAQALKQCGMDDRSIEIGTGVLAFLAEPELIEGLLSGKRAPRELWG